MGLIRIAVIGLGKIARDQHLPAIAGSDEFQLAATVDPGAKGLPDVPHFSDLATLLADGPKLDAVALCMPPRFRYDIASAALACGLHVLLEKPPCATLRDAEMLSMQAKAMDVSLFAAWHSRFANGVEPARSWLARRQIKHVVATWHEDVRVWHPGQNWILEEGGFGVFDPGINALSILTRILPLPFRLSRATLLTPANWKMPIAARLAFRDNADTEIVLDLDWTKSGVPRWDIAVATDSGLLKLEAGGSILSLPNDENRQAAEESLALSGEYPELYTHFARLIGTGKSDADMEPLLHVTDAFEIAEQRIVEMFED